MSHNPSEYFLDPMSSSLLLLYTWSVVSSKTDVYPLSQSCLIKSKNSLYNCGKTRDGSRSFECRFRVPSVGALIFYLSGIIASGPCFKGTWLVK